MCGGGDQVSVFKRRGDGFSCYQTTDMSHVSKHVGLNVSAQLREKACKGRKKHKIRIQIYTTCQGNLGSNSVSVESRQSSLGDSESFFC